MGGSLTPFSNNRRYYIGGLIVVIIIGALIANATMSASPAKKNVKESPIVTITIQKDIGVDTVTYNNWDSYGEIKTLTILELPYSFNATRGDTVELTETTRSGFLWNGWDFSPMSRSNIGAGITHSFLIDTNDDTYCKDNQIIITPSHNILRVIATATPTPTAQPTATPTASPTPTPTATQPPFTAQTQIVTPTPTVIYIVK